MGFRNMLLGYRDADQKYILENIVFLELIRKEASAFISEKSEKLKVDFVAEKPDHKMYIQVTESMQVPETRERVEAS